MPSYVAASSVFVAKQIFLDDESRHLCAQRTVEIVDGNGLVCRSRSRVAMQGRTRKQSSYVRPKWHQEASKQDADCSLPSYQRPTMQQKQHQEAMGYVLLQLIV